MQNEIKESRSGVFAIVTSNDASEFFFGADNTSSYGTKVSSRTCCLFPRLYAVFPYYYGEYMLFKIGLALFAATVATSIDATVTFGLQVPGSALLYWTVLGLISFGLAPLSRAKVQAKSRDRAPRLLNLPVLSSSNLRQGQEWILVGGLHRAKASPHPVASPRHNISTGNLLLQRKNSTRIHVP